MSLQVNVAWLFNKSAIGNQGILAIVIEFCCSGLSIMVCLSYKLFQKLLDYGRQEISLECCDTFGRLSGYEVDTDDLTMRFSALKSNLLRYVNIQILKRSHECQYGYNVLETSCPAHTPVEKAKF